MRRLLLDTHVYIWWSLGDERLSATARKAIIEAEAVYVSAASVWEASIKAGLGKLDVDLGALVANIAASGFFELPVRSAHALRVHDLPPHHRDPFDRLLVAQALHEPLVLLTADALLSPYSDLVVTI